MTDLELKDEVVTAARAWCNKWLDKNWTIEQVEQHAGPEAARLMRAVSAWEQQRK